MREILSYLNDDSDKLFAHADSVRRFHKGDFVHVRGLIEFTNYCIKNCLYCGIRYDNFHIKRYRLTTEQVLSSVKSAVEKGVKTIVLQGGEDSYFNYKELCSLISAIKEYDVALTLRYVDCNAGKEYLSI